MQYKFFCYLLLCSFLILTGCSKKDTGYIQQEEPAQINMSETTEDNVEERIVEPDIIDADWADYFGQFNGAAVIYDTSLNCYQIYNEELAFTQRSPCSTFKIISSLTALKNGIIEPDDSTRPCVYFDSSEPLARSN